MNEKLGELPRGVAKVECRTCKAVYIKRTKDITKTANNNKGYFPCDRCGSTETTWEFGNVKE